MKQKTKNLKQDKKNNVSKKRAKKIKTEEKPKINPILKITIFMFVIALIVGISLLTLKLYTFKKLAKEMFNNSPSTVYDSSNNMIAQIGTERNRINVSYSEIPKNLVNAYISIEDERFYKHHGVDIKRTGAAILSYITKHRLIFFWWKYNNTTISKKHYR